MIERTIEEIEAARLRYTRGDYVDPVSGRDDRNAKDYDKMILAEAYCLDYCEPITPTIEMLQDKGLLPTPFDDGMGFVQECESWRCQWCGRNTEAIATHEQKDVTGAWLPMCSGCANKKLRHQVTNAIRKILCRPCTCVGTCKGADGLGPNWHCVMGKPSSEVAGQ